MSGFASNTTSKGKAMGQSVVGEYTVTQISTSSSSSYTLYTRLSNPTTASAHTKLWQIAWVESTAIQMKIHQLISFTLSKYRVVCDILRNSLLFPRFIVTCVVVHWWIKAPPCTMGQNTRSVGYINFLWVLYQLPVRQFTLLKAVTNFCAIIHSNMGYDDINYLCHVRSSARLRN